MRHVAGFAVFGRVVDQFERQNLTGMAAKAVFIGRLDAFVRLVAFVTVEPRHGDPVRKVIARRFPVAGQAAVPVRYERLLLPRRKRMAPHAGNILHPHPVNFPILMTAKTGVLFRTEGMNLLAVTILAGQLLHEDVTGMAR